MRELLDADVFRRAHPDWPGVSPGEYPLDRDGNVIPDDPSAADLLYARHPDWAVVTGPLDDEDRRLIREEGWL